MLAALTLLLTCQLIGEVLVVWLQLPLPGPVLGMVLLLVILIIRGDVSKELQETGTGLLKHLSLLFVPAGVGVMVHMHLIGEQALPLISSLIVSTMAGLALTGLVMKWLRGKTADKAQGHE